MARGTRSLCLDCDERLEATWGFDQATAGGNARHDAPQAPTEGRGSYDGRVRYPRRIRLDREVYEDLGLVFHLTLRAHPKLARWPATVGEAIWASVLEQLESDRVELFAACLMPDHLHLLVRRGRLDAIAFVDEWKSWTTRLSWSVGNRNALWQPGMWDRTMRDEDDLLATASYIARNPVDAGLVEDEREWPWTWVWWW